jgi:hypothetical protein
MGHLVMENRNGLIVDALVTRAWLPGTTTEVIPERRASGTAERAAALAMLGRQGGRHRATLGADKAYDVAGFVADLRALTVTPHVAQNTANRRSTVGSRATPAMPRASAPPADRGELRLDQDRGRPAQDPPSWHSGSAGCSP